MNTYHCAGEGDRKCTYGNYSSSGRCRRWRECKNQARRHCSDCSGTRDLLTVEVLLKAGAEVNATNKWGETALDCAVSSGHFDVVEALLKAGAKGDRKIKSGDSSLKPDENNVKIQVPSFVKQPLVLNY